MSESTMASERWPTWRIALRLLAGWGLMLGLLMYLWGRTLIGALLMGHPEPKIVVAMAAIFAIVAGLLWGLGREPSLARWGWKLPMLMGASWFLGNCILAGISMDSTIPVAIVAVVYALSAIWVFWVATMMCWQIGWPARIGVLLVLLTFPAILVTQFRIVGLTGDSQVTLDWRSAREAVDAEELGLESKLADSSTNSLKSSPSDFPEFLGGPRRDGIVTGIKLARDWKSRPPREMWRKKVGAGWGGFAIVGDLAFTQEQRGEKECVVCYQLTSGEQRWVHADKILFEASLGGPGPRATPTVHDGRVFAIGATGKLNCLDAITGKLLWSREAIGSSPAENIAHGVCGSPLVVGDLVIVCPTKDVKWVAAFHAANGEPAWSAGNSKASYSSPMLVEIHGVPQILLFNSVSLASHDPATGAILWSFPWTNFDGNNCSQASLNAGGPDRIFLSTGYGTGAVLLSVTQKEGKWNVAPLWTTRAMKNKFTSSLVVGDHVYGLDDGILACVRLSDGGKAWKQGRYGHGQCLLVGGLLLIQAEKPGDIVLVDPNPKELLELARIPAMASKTWNTPALAGKHLLVRNDREAVCFELPLEESTTASR